MTVNRTRINRPALLLIQGGRTDPAPARADPEAVEAVEETADGQGCAADKLYMLDRALALRAQGKLRDTDITVVVALLSAVDGATFVCCMYRRTLIQRTGLSRAAVTRALAALARTDFLVRRARRTEGGRNQLQHLATEYRLIGRERVRLQKPAAIRGSERSPLYTGLRAEPVESIPEDSSPSGEAGRRGRAADDPHSTVAGDGTRPRNRPRNRPRTARPAHSPNLARELFGPALAYLTQHGIAERRARAMIGRWRKLFGDEAVGVAICDASDRQVSEPLAWIEAALRSRGGGRRGNSTKEELQRAAAKAVARQMAMRRNGE